MVALKIVLDEDQYRRLKQRAHGQGVSVEELVTELLDELDEWQQALANDPVAELFGQLDDRLDPADIDTILYSADRS